MKDAKRSMETAAGVRVGRDPVTGAGGAGHE